MTLMRAVAFLALAGVSACENPAPVANGVPIASVKLNRTYVATACGYSVLRAPPCGHYGSGSTHEDMDSARVTFRPDGSAEWSFHSHGTYNSCYLIPKDCTVAIGQDVLNQTPYMFDSTAIRLPDAYMDQLRGVNLRIGFTPDVMEGFQRLPNQRLPTHVPEDWAGPDSLLVRVQEGTWMGSTIVFKPVPGSEGARHE